jgi:hypothetical protein
VVVYDLKLRSSALFIFLDERELPGWLMFLASGSIEEVQRRNITPVSPQGRGPGSFGVIRLVCVGSHGDSKGAQDVKCFSEWVLHLVYKKLS